MTKDIIPATSVGLDIAKTWFQAHGADGEGKPVFRHKLRRDQVISFFTELPPTTIGMEACSTAPHWARQLSALGHNVRLIPPQYVKPFVKRSKTDSADAEAICETLRRSGIRDVAVKSIEQQGSLMCIARATCWCVNARCSPTHCADLLPNLGWSSGKALGTSQSCGRDFAAWLGLVPRQFSSGGKARLGRTSKAGQADIRRLLIIGAMSRLNWLSRKSIPEGSWLERISSRKPRMLVAITLVNKMARTIWALIIRKDDYRVPAQVVVA